MPAMEFLHLFYPDISTRHVSINADTLIDNMATLSILLVQLIEVILSQLPFCTETLKSSCLLSAPLVDQAR